MVSNAMIINGSPRAPISNSKLYADVFKQNYKGDVIEFNVIKDNYDRIIQTMNTVDNLIFIFPLYIDSIPVPLLNFLKYLEVVSLHHKPTVHVLINCGFREPEQCLVAVDTMKLFCEINDFPFSSSLRIGCGEAFMKTPLAFLAKRKIKSFAKTIYNQKTVHTKVSMPLSQKSFVKAARTYWIKYGNKFGCTEQELETMEIE